MEKIGRSQAITKKGKKKHTKDELDRQKQAEKKRRRLEKALATSAAIRSELEKKKQKKMEEQQRLDEEGLAIAESVALHVLIGEDMEESHNFMLDNSRRYYPCDSSGNIGLFMGFPSFKWSTEEWNESLTRVLHVKDTRPQSYEEKCGVLAAEAVARLQIAEYSHKVPFSSNQVNSLYKEH